MWSRWYLRAIASGMRVAQTQAMTNALHVPTAAIPWLAAILLGATAHLGWLTHDCAPTRDLMIARSPQVVVVEASPTQASIAPEIAAVPRPVPAPACEAEGAYAHLEADVRCSSEHSCSISRRLAKRLETNLPGLARQCRFVPSMRDGQQVGYKVYGIHRGSLPHLLGIENGDLFVSANGRMLVSVDDAMAAAMTALRLGTPSDHMGITFNVERKGELLTKTFHVFDESDTTEL